MISSFQGKNRWLSNFWPCSIWYGEYHFKSLENAYQAAKCQFRKDISKFIDITPGQAKKLSKEIPVDPNWNNIKLHIMEALLRQKFSDKNPELKELLIATGDQELVEGNNWNDTFFGVCNGVGENHLGKLLMKIRKNLKNEI